MTKTYKVAEHCFCIEAEDDFLFWNNMDECYGPFETSLKECSKCFTLKLDNSFVLSKDKTQVYTNQNDVKEGFIIFSVFKTEDNNHYFEISQPSSIQLNGYMNISSDFSDATLKLSGTKLEQWNTFNTAVNLCFQLSTLGKETLVLHASAVEYKGRAYLFLGKSGTGKSTHSRMWIKALETIPLWTL